jgi:hypothetical protein
MARKKFLRGIGHPAHVLAARAGIIPDSDYIENEINLRVARIHGTVSAYAKRNGDGCDLAIMSILQDLRHYCDSKGLVFHELDMSAEQFYMEDAHESPWMFHAG